MKINEHTALLTPKVLLVPYSSNHVPTYHDWMQDPELQTATASEPLTLDQEYEMQRSWRTDEDKLTFIACVTAEESKISGNSILPGHLDGPEHMIGDVNLFLSEIEEEIGDDDEKKADAIVGLVGEVEIMIAKKHVQGKGYGRAVLLAFLWYVLDFLEQNRTENWRTRLQMLRVKIDKDNERSIGLFKSVGFKLVTETPNYFGEVELRWILKDSSLEQLQAETHTLRSCHEPRVLRYV